MRIAKLSNLNMLLNNKKILLLFLFVIINSGCERIILNGGSCLNFPSFNFGENSSTYEVSEDVVLNLKKNKPAFYAKSKWSYIFYNINEHSSSLVGMDDNRWIAYDIKAKSGNWKYLFRGKDGKRLIAFVKSKDCCRTYYSLYKIDQSLYYRRSLDEWIYFSYEGDAVLDTLMINAFGDGLIVFKCENEKKQLEYFIYKISFWVGKDLYSASSQKDKEKFLKNEKDSTDEYLKSLMNYFIPVNKYEGNKSAYSLLPHKARNNPLRQRRWIY